MPEGGPWKSIFVYDNDHSPAIGDLIQISGQVWEYNGLTELKNISSFQIVSSGNAIPSPAVISTQMVNTEAYESVYCQINQVNCTVGLNQYNDWLVSDGSADAKISGGFFNQSALSDIINPGQAFDFIKGIAYYNYGEFRLNPRNSSEVQPSLNSHTVSIPDVDANINEEAVVNLNVSNLAIEDGYNNYHFIFNYDPNIISFINYDSNNTLSSGGAVTISNQTANSFQVQFFKNGFITGSGLLLKLRFNAVGAGDSGLEANNFYFNETQFSVVNGSCHVHNTSGIEHPDTITVIQRPLPNIPEITIPGEQFKIYCTAPQNTVQWSVSLIRKGTDLPVVLNSAVYENTPPRWALSVTTPNVPLFEQYDLKVTASNGINDISKKCVKVIPSRRTNYYFAHITDIHMPTHIFWPDDGYDTDSTETVDFREVIKDLNLIRPEFVLLTGDIVNQGENEDLENLQWYSKAQRLLLEFEVPVYLVAGNHDIGGWTDQPPSDGTARRDWWKFFGWSWLNNSNISYPFHTQDYSFEYGPIKFIGMEAYDNYDNWWQSIYGTQSFTAQQISWLNSELNNTDADTKVMFYHYDFSNQLNLNSLGVNMGLWGHIHSDEGSITQIPYNLATAATCDGRRSYRIIQVNNAIVIPFNTVSAGPGGNMLQVNYYPSNSGFADSVRAVVANNHILEFDNGLLKFIMPAGNSNYLVQNGVIEQIERTPQYNTVYVKVHIPSLSSINVILWENGSPIDDNLSASVSLILRNAYPNPFQSRCTTEIKSTPDSNIRISVYNIKGEKITSANLKANQEGKSSFSWNGTNSNGQSCANGIYFIKAQNRDNTKTVKVMLLK
jgi:3',5'-cyclic AMP phosphodiesterase CpdA